MFTENKAGCKYCTGTKEITTYNFGNDLSVKIESDLLLICYDAYSLDSSFKEKFKIKYCPMCGRELKIKEIK
jgi:hypothetical protein